MKKRISVVALECLLDLGITVIYAAFVGLLIVAIVVSDNGPISILRVSLYATILPAAALALILGEIGLRIVKEWKAARHAAPFRPGRHGSLSPSRP